MAVLANPRQTRDALRLPWVADCSRPGCVFYVGCATVEAAYDVLRTHACPRPVQTHMEPLVQTFLPYADFEMSAQVLDNARLGKQRAEVIQILKSLTDPTYGWGNHPAVKMWNGYTAALAVYGMTICEEWAGTRGYNDTCWSKINAFYVPDTSAEPNQWGQRFHMPPWFGTPAFHDSHKSNLKRKRPDIYGHLWPQIPDSLEYVWPSITA